MKPPRSDADDRLERLLLARTPEERLRMVSRMFSGTRTLVVAGFEGPRGDAAALRRHVFLRFYGRDFEDAERERILAHLVRH